MNGGTDYIINHLKFTVLVHEYEGRGTQIIETGEEGMVIISEAKQKNGSRSVLWRSSGRLRRFKDLSIFSSAGCIV